MFSQVCASFVFYFTLLSKVLLYTLLATGLSNGLCRGYIDIDYSGVWEQSLHTDHRTIESWSSGSRKMHKRVRKQLFSYLCVCNIEFIPTAGISCCDATIRTFNKCLDSISFRLDQRIRSSQGESFNAKLRWLVELAVRRLMKLFSAQFHFGALASALRHRA